MTIEFFSLAMFVHSLCSHIFRKAISCEFFPMIVFANVFFFFYFLYIWVIKVLIPSLGFWCGGADDSK